MIIIIYLVTHIIMFVCILAIFTQSFDFFPNSNYETA